MRKVLRVILILVGVFAFLLVGTGVALAATVLHSGLVVVKVHEKGPDGAHFTIPVPASLLQAGMTVAIHNSDEAEMDRVRAQLAPWRPALSESLDQLRAVDDFTMVDVDGRDEHVSIRKRGDTWVIDVQSSDADVYVSMPLGLLEHALAALGD